MLERIVNRVSCPACGEIYNKKFTPPIKDGVCDKCGAGLTQRKDDTEEVAKSRFATYHKETEPLIEFYSSRNQLIALDAQGSSDEIYARIKELI